MSDTHTYSATPGFALIKPESMFADTGLIELPEKYRQKKKSVARVESWSPQYRFRCRCGNVQHFRGACTHCQRRDKMKLISSVPTAPFAGDITGLRVIYMEHAVARITDDLYRLPIDCILAIIPDDMELEQAGDVSNKRCRFCGPARSGSSNGMLLIPKNGVLRCPRCKKDQNGNVVKD